MNHELNLEEVEYGWMGYCECEEWNLTVASDNLEDWDIIKMIRKKFLTHKAESEFDLTPAVPNPFPIYPSPSWPYDGTGDPPPWWQNPIITWNSTDFEFTDDDDEDYAINIGVVEFR